MCKFIDALKRAFGFGPPKQTPLDPWIEITRHHAEVRRKVSPGVYELRSTRHDDFGRTVDVVRVTEPRAPRAAPAPAPSRDFDHTDPYLSSLVTPAAVAGLDAALTALFNSDTTADSPASAPEATASFDSGGGGDFGGGGASGEY